MVEFPNRLDSTGDVTLLPSSVNKTSELCELGVLRFDTRRFIQVILKLNITLPSMLLINKNLIHKIVVKW